ncbi:MAG: hypothetical protein WC446_07005, partial [Candidatus Paceibacterota bacterium]
NNTISQVNVIDLLSYNTAIVGSVKGVGREGHPARQAIGKRGQAAFTIVKLRQIRSRETVVKRW